MLAITDQAASAIDGILAARQLPEEAGVRITTQLDVSDGGTPEPTVQMAVVAAPESGDQVLENTAVFVEPEAAALLDDKLLDAELSGEKLKFALKSHD